MKNNKLKICFAIIIILAENTLKAQSIQQKFQKDNEDRRKQAAAIRLKAREQQAQQQSEKINGTSNTVQPNISTVLSQLKKEETKIPAPVKKSEPINQPASDRKENTK